MTGSTNPRVQLHRRDAQNRSRATKRQTPTSRFSRPITAYHLSCGTQPGVRV